MRLAGAERVSDELTVHDQDLDLLFGPLLAPFKRAVLAVSGGSDSMALMVLAARWVASGRAPAGLMLDVATVDHGLRASSAREADWVAERAKALGFSHTTLVWGGNKPGSALQARAREARYALLVAHARADTPAAVVTAHTRDDQAETLLMRLGRGSGLDGLAGMAPVRPLLPDGSVQLVRPLLALSKASLIAMLREVGSTWIDDPSNERLDFERVRLRGARDHLVALGLSNDKLALSATRLWRARDALDQVTEAKLRTLVDEHGGVYGSLERAAWEAEPEEIRVRLLARLIGAFGGEARPAQLSQVEALVAALARGRPMAQTLAGCIVSQGRTTLRLYREPGHHTLRTLRLTPGDEAVWDMRFRLRYAVPEADAPGDDGVGMAAREGPAAMEPVVVRPLGLQAYATLRGRLAPKDRPPARAAAGLPSIWAEERLLAVPSLSGAPSDNRFRAEFLGLKRELR
ncbi:tRNA lysidine(34) synthetase TilS [Hyphomicrobium sp. CS1GBMeth3]|uniref:tRNA lysidine(34) synthetase TilS n=1 Tax=Hyphomicrobium sp. CS1GBMeth3 TaxID=1892845 RepID=UPI0009F83B35|nr:tRNA lysidine(34) synthetase TilS [Hyphomicrobium sp. CS1GBMeth3]